MVQGGGWGCGPEQLAATVPCAPITVDVSQWRGAHSLWQCSVNILEHSGCSGGSPGALHLINILYMDIYQIIYIITTNSWASRRYYESQTTVSGSPTSLVLPLPHQSETEPLAARCRLPAARCPLQGVGASRWWCLVAAGSGAPAGDNRGQQSLATIPFSSMSWFSLLQIDVDVEEPETSFEIHNIVWRLTQLLAVMICMI